VRPRFFCCRGGHRDRHSSALRMDPRGPPRLVVFPEFKFRPLRSARSQGIVRQPELCITAPPMVGPCPVPSSPLQTNAAPGWSRLGLSPPIRLRVCLVAGHRGWPSWKMSTAQDCPWGLVPALTFTVICSLYFPSVGHRVPAPAHKRPFPFAGHSWWPRSLVRQRDEVGSFRTRAGRSWGSPPSMSPSLCPGVPVFTVHSHRNRGPK